MNKVVYGLKDVGEFETLKEACKCLFEKVKDEIAAETLTLQGLETTVWIETKAFLHIDFYSARDIAVDNKWVDNKGDWIGG